ncbi:hypothetical protein GCM10010911_06670 [Paenibacillus nasutitermitis]|uniref:YD repeat-containing protein n=1 Tax=Paenibacillus nasutitermitis TaxID=1652958 RepID=A0A916YLL1_9BACL|nr:hypothetical protein GCM10010911_06670 [Paenibacillus nasutitermitis]
MQDETGTTSYSYILGTGEQSQVTYPDGNRIAYSLDENGNRNQMSDSFGGNEICASSNAAICYKIW